MSHTGAAAPPAPLTLNRTPDGPNARHSTLRRQHDLADVGAALDESMRVGGALERERARDDRREAPGEQLAISMSISGASWRRSSHRWPM